MSSELRGMAQEVQPEEAEETPPPLVPKRTARLEEIPAEARRAAGAIAARGLPVWVTFAQGGAWRRWRDRGECSTCGATPLLMAEDRRDEESGAVLQAHSPSRVHCDARSTTFHLGLVVCAGCGLRPARLNKDGTMPSHDRPTTPCPDRSASRLIPGGPRPPVTSIAVRALPHTGVAVWDTEPGKNGKIEGSFAFGFVVHRRRLMRVSAAEFQRACKGL